MFHDSVLTAALTERLTHRAHINNMVGGSYRILETKEWIEQSNLLRLTFQRYTVKSLFYLSLL
ncbi:hypothetical protein [Solibacillus merdavium]|uniref:hypothetical protein n=1 Tax=Solibacillus merdavium TaxID=2762218 RepID=UPI00296FEC3E|nr:hypothetical protein [Solibacillus merdavium]